MLAARTSSSRWLRGCIGRHELPPVFLCPALHSILPGRCGLIASRSPPQSRSSVRRIHAEATAPDTRARTLPLQCPGCGAFSQTTASDKPGFFDLNRKATQRHLGLLSEVPRPRVEDDLVRETLRIADGEKLRRHGVDVASFLPPPERQLDPERVGPPLCGRCHDLVHHNIGTPIYHPGIDSIRETLAESPHRKNHVYHVLDAADFPMSLVPRIHELLELEPQRSRNRRSRRPGFPGSYRPEMSFVVTRSDLLAPSRDQVDRLMPWLTETLRDALGRAGQGIRLGNIRLVSAKRTWWTKELRDEIWLRGGAAWMVGKANVGKSYLCQHVFPKGRMDGGGPPGPPPAAAELEQEPLGGDELEEGSGLLLPPPPPEINYPRMPVVSALPGTTASPIRIPFGNGKGEVIDLPGLARSSLGDYVSQEHQGSLVMRSRIQPTQQVLKSDRRSLLLGGFIRLTPRTPDVVFLAYNFTPLQEHLTETEKAIGIQDQTSSLNVENISIPGTGSTIQLAGSFALKYDVTKQRAGPITRRDAANIKVEHLPYRVLAIDILIEGCGWVEVVAQVRSKNLFGRGDASDEGRGIEPMDGGSGEPCWPIIDVYSPEGKFIGARRPLNAWMLCQPRKVLKSRPRKSMKGAKKRAKTAARAASSMAEAVGAG